MWIYMLLTLTSDVNMLSEYDMNYHFILMWTFFMFFNVFQKWHCHKEYIDYIAKLL